MRATMRCCLFLMLFLAAVPLTRAQALSGEAINHLPLSSWSSRRLSPASSDGGADRWPRCALLRTVHREHGLDTGGAEPVEVLTGTQDLLDQSGAPLVALSSTRRRHRRQPVQRV